MLGMRISILLCRAWFWCLIIRKLGKCRLLDLLEMVKKWFFLLSLVIWKNTIFPGRVILSVCCVLQFSGKKFGGKFLSQRGLRHFLCQIGLLGCYLCYWECFWRRLFVVTLFGGWFWIMGFFIWCYLGMFLLLVIPIEKLFSTLTHMRAQTHMHFTRAYYKMSVFKVELDKYWSSCFGRVCRIMFGLWENLS